MAVKASIRDIDTGWAAMKRRLANRVDITVGIHAADGAEPKKGAPGEGGTSLIEVALAHEFGLGVPRRSFIADWQDENAERHRKQVAAMARAVVAGTIPDVETAAARLANLWVAEVQKRIVAGIAPPLSPRTIKRKKSSTPLIDTGQLRSAIAYAINNKLRPSKNFEQATRERAKAQRKADAAKAKAEKKAAAKTAPKKARARRPPKKPIAKE